MLPEDLEGVLLVPDEPEDRLAIEVDAGLETAGRFTVADLAGDFEPAPVEANISVFDGVGKSPALFSFVLVFSEAAFSPASSSFFFFSVSVLSVDVLSSPRSPSSFFSGSSRVRSTLLHWLP